MPRAAYTEGPGVWSVPCEIALPCATQNDLALEDAKRLCRNGCFAVAEGAISKEDAKLSKKELKEKKAKQKYPSVAYEISEKIQKKTDQEVRITVPGHTQRGGSPCAYDRVLATRLGAAAAEAILDGDFGCMVAVKNRDIARVPLSEVAGKLKYVDPESDIVREAKMTGISFGDK